MTQSMFRDDIPLILREVIGADVAVLQPVKVGGVIRFAVQLLRILRLIGELRAAGDRARLLHIFSIVRHLRRVGADIRGL